MTGVVLANLDRHQEAADMFRWVIQQGGAKREEVTLARQWLADAGFSPASTAAKGAVPPPGPRPVAAITVADATAQLTGRTEWKGLEPGRATPRLQLLLVGDDRTSQGRRYVTRVSLNEPYRFTGIAPGEYRLLGQVGSTRLWDVKVSVREGKPTVLDLTEAAAVAAPDALRSLGS